MKYQKIYAKINNNDFLRGRTVGNPTHFSLWAGSGAKEQKKLFLMGGLRGERTKKTFPYGWAAGQRGAKYKVLKFIKAL
ncbi:hypothetical protein X925_00060 [Petrotoga sp. 9T1HF07.CasAA.8.2]|nr:hypothetical protein X925_00060 [Petrotoga sp. 9T1HF07.CasAA.8.2]PNR93016.1 hypothetical protein X926_04695 [Petrotoga sp. HWHPT.55.6.3]